MKCLIDTHDRNKGDCPEQELTEERFLEQFAALEDGLALLQIHMRSLSENAKLFGSLAKRMRRSICSVLQRSESAGVGMAKLRTAVINGRSS